MPNQFYNPHGPAKRTRNRQEGREVRAYAKPYDPYPWCAFLFRPGELKLGETFSAASVAVGAFGFLTFNRAF